MAWLNEHAAILMGVGFGLATIEVSLVNQLAWTYGVVKHCKKDVLNMPIHPGVTLNKNLPNESVYNHTL